MNYVFQITLLVILFLLLAIIIWKFINTNYHDKALIPEINSADKNISTSRIDELISEWKKAIGLEPFNIILKNDLPYKNFNKNFNKKTKQLVIPIWLMQSVGYEIDYILGRMWISSRFYKGDKLVSKIYLSIKLLIPLSYIFFYSFFIFGIIMYSFQIMDFELYIAKSNFLFFIYKYCIFQSISFLGFLSLILNILILNKAKENIEIQYELDLYIFVSKNCTDYKFDIEAARVYATSFKKLYIPNFKNKRNINDLKYFGPFTYI